jgi:hypothetical protein
MHRVLVPGQLISEPLVPHGPLSRLPLGLDRPTEACQRSLRGRPRLRLRGPGHSSAAVGSWVRLGPAHATEPGHVRLPSVLRGYRLQELGSLMTIVCDSTIWVRPHPPPLPLPLHPHPTSYTLHSAL